MVAAMHLKSGSPREIRAMNAMIERGPVTIMLVFSNTCPHCTTYMPIWKKLCATKGRKANMISMEASTYQKTPMSSEKPVSGVPTVLYVNQKGEISEAREPRNTEIMTNAVKLEPGSDLPDSVIEANKPASAKTLTANSNLFEPIPSEKRISSEPVPAPNAVIPGTMSSENPLAPLPGTVQSGGNPWAAFLIAAKQAAPAAALLGAYAALPAKRSSGLSAPSRRTKRRSSRRRNRRSVRR